MMNDRRQRGFTVVELLVSLTVLLLVLAGCAQMMVQNSHVNRSQQMAAAAQADVRNCLELIQQKLRSAGWDPMNAGIATVAVDPDLTDLVSEIEIFADLDADTFTDSVDEQILIRHLGEEVVWRRSNDVADPFIVLANNITNDADGDGTPEAIFVPFPAVDPAGIRITITARSPQPDPVSGEFIRYTLSSDVILRKAL
jgi:prepilin-type N-terminal cleavage/methylation domain-containing protein